MNKVPVSIMWFRRDLRLQDNAALYHALKSAEPVVPLFIFDKLILDDLECKEDRRIEFIFEALESMQAELTTFKSSLIVRYGKPEEVFQKLLEEFDIKMVFTNEDYEQYAIDRDNTISILLRSHGAELRLYKDTVVFSKDEIVKSNGLPYTVFTPYSRQWLAKLTPFYIKPYPVLRYAKRFYRQIAVPFPSLESMGFAATGKPFPSREINESVIRDYDRSRDFPADEKGTSRLGIHLRFGTLSIRQLVAKAKEWNAVFLKELIWRDFYQMILWQNNAVRKGQSFKPQFDNIEWRNNEAEFEAWCTGNTGYPIVDAGMRQMNETGYMHNRVRMITASFLTKHLLIDWRWGEAYFARQLLDYDYAANNGGWQWSAGTGADPSPYFRVFNPTTQTKKFDPKLVYVKRWVPEFESISYQPIVEHSFARERALKAYKKALKRE